MIIVWAPLSLLPPGLLLSSRRKQPAFISNAEPKGKGKAKADEEAEDSGDDNESENEVLEFAEDEGDTTMGGDSVKKREFDEVIDLTTRGTGKNRDLMK